MKETPFPAVPVTLLERLEELWPNRLPDAPISDTDLAREVGRQDVIRKLRHEYERQQKHLTST